jgi:hypothetical protein
VLFRSSFNVQQSGHLNCPAQKQRLHKSAQTKQ